MKLSLCMIVKNEEDVLARALSGVAFADEIIIVDTGSSDGTKAIAREYTDKVYDFEWRDDFSAARNYSFSLATCEYIMWLDADDTVPQRTAERISELKHSGTDADIIMLPYVLGYCADGNPSFSFYRERIVKNAPEYRWSGRVHEAIELKGKVVKLPYDIVHAKPHDRAHSTRNLDIYNKMLEEGVRLSPRERYYYARELFYSGRYRESAHTFCDFLAEPDGFYINKLDACLQLSRCYEHLGESERALETLFLSFRYGAPNGEIACEIGQKFFARSDYALAAYWFERAASAKPLFEAGAFVDADCYTFLPYVWLTVCYDRLGNLRAAYYWHCRARRIRPDHPSVIANEAYFKKLKLTKGG